MMIYDEMWLERSAAPPKLIVSYDLYDDIWFICSNACFIHDTRLREELAEPRGPHAVGSLNFL